MPEINGVEFGAISFSGGMTDGVADAFPTPPAEADPTVRFQEPDTAPTEHHNILETPVTLPDPPKAKRKSALRTQLEGMYTMAGTAMYMVDPNTATVIVSNAAACAESLDDLAQKNPKVKAALESMLATSAWSAVIAAHLPIAVQLGTTYVPELKRRYMKTATNDSAAA